MAAQTTPDSPHLRHGEADLLEIADRAVKAAVRLGLGAVAHGSESGGLSVTARSGRAEVRTGDQSQRLTVTVHDGLRRGTASTGKFDRAAVEATVERARAIAAHGGEDAEAALPEPATLAQPRAVPLFRTSGWSTDDLAAYAIAIEAVMLDEGARLGVETVADGAGATAHDHRTAMVASNGFAGAYSGSSAARWGSVAAGPEGARRLASSMSNQRDSSRLRSPDEIGRDAAMRAARRLDPRGLASRQAPILFENLIARDLIGSLLGALSGSAQMNHATFLPGAIGTAVAASHLSIHEDPFLPFGAASAPFDGEGISGQARDIVAQGIATGYFLDTRAARRLGMASTGNANGPYNLRIDSSGTASDDDAAAMLRKLGTGLFVTGLSGQGVNALTGDYSRAATGFWVEDGTIAYPVEDVTLVGNLKTMLLGIVAVGADRVPDGAMACGSILLDRLDIVGR